MPGIKGDGSVFPLNLTGGAAATLGAVTAITALWSAALGWTLNWQPGMLSAATRIYRQDAEETAEQPNSKTLKVRLNTVTGSAYSDRFEPRPGVTYTYFLAAVDALGNESVYSSVTCVTPDVNQNTLNLWPNDLTKNNAAASGANIMLFWAPGSGVTVAPSGNNVGATTVTFTGAGQTLLMRVPIYNMNRANSLYTAYLKVKGSGSVSVRWYGDFGNGGFPTGTNIDSAALTLTGGVDEFAPQRPNTQGDCQYMQFGLVSTAAGNIDVFDLRLSAGTLSLAQMRAVVAGPAVAGPGTTWHEPVNGNQALTLTGLFFRSRDAQLPGVACIGINSQNDFVFNRCRTDTESGAHIGGQSGGQRFNIDNHRAYGRTPKVQGASRGRLFVNDYVQRLVMRNFYAYRVGGAVTQYFRGVNSATDTLTWTGGFYRDLDGRCFNADGTPVQNTYGGNNVAQGPASIGQGSVICNALGFHGIESSPAGGFSNPNGAGIVGGEHAYIVHFGRVGWCKHEDFYNYAGLRGTATSPFRTHDILDMCFPSPDLEYLNGTTTGYTLGRQLTAYTLTLTTSGSVTGTGAVQNIPLTSALLGPVGQGATFTLGGISLTANSTAARGVNAISVNGFSGTIASGASYTGTFKWGPDYVSSTGGLNADSGDSTRWEQNGAYHETYNIVAIGPELILSDQAYGNDRNMYACEVWIPTTLFDGVTPVTGMSRNNGYQFNTFPGLTIPDKNATQQPALQNVSLFNCKTFGGNPAAFTNTVNPAWRGVGHVIYPAPTAAQCWARAEQFMADLAARGIVVGPTA